MNDRRNYGLDLLRIIAMLGIVILHINGQGGVLKCCEDYQWKSAISKWVEICAYTSVDIFGLLSGYLGVNKKSASSYRTIELIFVTMFYCGIITILFWFLIPETINGGKGIMSCIFPFKGLSYWYIICYIPIGIFQPYINKMLLSLTEKDHLRLSTLIICVFGFVQSFVSYDMFVFNSGYSFIWLLCLYVIGAYIKRKNLFSDSKHKIIKPMMFFFASSFVLLVGNYLVSKIINMDINYFISYISPIILFMSISLFIMFRDLNFSIPKKVYSLFSLFSVVTFDVYLIHCHILIWESCIKNRFTWITEYDAILIPFIILLAGIAIVLLTSMIGIARTVLFNTFVVKKPLMIIAKKIDTILYN